MKYFWLLLCLVSCIAQADEIAVRITEELPYIDVPHEDGSVRVQRIQNEENILEGAFAKTSRKCPPFCIHPMRVAEGVETIGEVELLYFMKDELSQETGLVIDARTPSWYLKGTIPGSVNIPFTEFSEPQDSPEIGALLARFGVVPAAEPDWVGRLYAWWLGLVGQQTELSRWDFSRARKLVLWCNGPWCDQSPRAIKSLLALGYPAEKIYYYRGGMQLWQILGLGVVIPDA